MAMYNKYKGNSGRVQRVEDKPVARQPVQRPAARPAPQTHSKLQPVVQAETRPPSPLSGLSGELGRILGKLGSLSLETEDLLLILILYLMYRESGDQDFLIMIGAFLFL